MQATIQFLVEQGPKPGTLILKFTGESVIPEQLLQELLEGAEPQIGGRYTVLSAELRLQTPPVQVNVVSSAPSNGFGLPQMDEDQVIPRGENQ